MELFRESTLSGLVCMGYLYPVEGYWEYILCRVFWRDVFRAYIGHLYLVECIRGLLDIKVLFGLCFPGFFSVSRVRRKSIEAKAMIVGRVKQVIGQEVAA